MKNSKIEGLIFDEAFRDIEAESRGISSTPGEMQRSFPDAYRAARELASSMADTLPALELSRRQAEKISEMLHSDDDGLSSIQEVLNMQPVNALTLAHLIRLERNRTGKKAADARHDEPGGAREKQKRIRDIWATGKYTSRDICAEQECAGLNWNFSSARKALRNTPDPT